MAHGGIFETMSEIYNHFQNKHIFIKLSYSASLQRKNVHIQEIF